VSPAILVQKETTWEIFHRSRIEAALIGYTAMH